jgi:glycosyltransferase involved in cell wall biosynthesis
MKCLIVSDSPSSGGLLTFLDNIVSINESVNFETVLLINDNTPPEFLSKFNSKNIEFKYFPPFENKLNVYNRLFKEYQNLRKIVSEINPDFVIINTGNPTYYFSFYFLKYPLIYVVHSLVMRLSWKSIFITLIPKLFSSSFKIMLTVSYNSRDRIKKYWFSNLNRIRVTYNPFNSANVEHVNRKNNKVILTIGHVISYKNPQMWLLVAEQIIKEYHDVTFFWVGDGPELDKYQDLTKDNSRINFVGYSSDVLFYYKKGYLYFQPSIFESQGIAVVEALANGIPCVVSNKGGLPEMVAHGITGFVCENDVESYIHFIRLGLSLSTSNYMCMSNNSVDYAIKKFDFNQFKLNILGIYEEIIEW